MSNWSPLTELSRGTFIATPGNERSRARVGGGRRSKGRKAALIWKEEPKNFCSPPGVRARFFRKEEVLPYHGNHLLASDQEQQFPFE